MLPWNRLIYHTQLSGWPEKAGNSSPHANPSIPAPTLGAKFQHSPIASILRPNPDQHEAIHTPFWCHISTHHPNVSTRYSNEHLTRYSGVSTCSQRIILVFQLVILTNIQRVVLAFQLE